MSELHTLRGHLAMHLGIGLLVQNGLDLNIAAFTFMKFLEKAIIVADNTPNICCNLTKSLLR